MIKPIQAIYRVLYGNVMVENKGIPVVKQSYPYDKTPCITLDDSGGVTTISKKITNKKLLLKSSHPQFELYHKELVGQQVICETKSTTININIWCDTERERESICKQVLNLFYKAQSDHYMFCSKYDNGYCSYLENECEAILDNTIRSVKNQCPYPYDYKYMNIFSRYDLIRDTFHVETPFSVDDLSQKKPILRSVMKVYTNYKDYYNIGGAISQNIEFDEDLL